MVCGATPFRTKNIGKLGSPWPGPSRSDPMGLSGEEDSSDDDSSYDVVPYGQTELFFILLY